MFALLHFAQIKLSPAAEHEYSILTSIHTLNPNVRVCMRLLELVLFMLVMPADSKCGKGSPEK